MGWKETFIQRPVFTTVLSLVIVIFGIIGVDSLGVREFPEAERPIISVRAEYPGASAEVIESQITEVLEEQVNLVPGIETLRSVSREGRSSLQIEFGLGDDLDRAANDVRDRVSAAMRRLPDDADPPVVEKADADGDPIVFLNIRSSTRSLLELTEIADTIFKPQFETILGVGRVDIWGSKEFSMRIWLDPDLMARYELTASDIRHAISRANVELPAGRVEGIDTDVELRVRSRLEDDPSIYEDIIVSGRGNEVVRLSDVATVELGPLVERTVLKRDQTPMVGVVIRPQSGANQIDIVDEFYVRLDRILPDLPDDIEIGIGFDTSEYIRASLFEVQTTIALAMILVCLTIFFFLREIRTSLIPLITIPVSLVGGLFIIYVAGFSINVLTLLAMVLAVGLVVDDAVVVLENIYKKIESGMEPKEAAIAGLNEIFLPVVASTLSLVAVFSPILFLDGLTGILFTEFGVTLAGIVVISSFVALSLTPMLGSKFLKQGGQHKWFYRVTEGHFQKAISLYQKSLSWILHARWLAAIVVIICLGLITLTYLKLPTELAPTEDRGLLVLSASGPPGANFNYMSGVMDHIDEVVLENIPETEAMLTVTSPGFGAATTVNSGFVRMVLKDRKDRQRSQGQIVRELEGLFRDIPEARVFVRQPETISTGSRGLPIQFVIQNQDFEKIRDALPLFLSAARDRPEFSFVDVDLEFNRPEVELQLDRNRAESLGVGIADIAETIQSALAGQRYGYFLRGGRQYEIVGQFERARRDEPGDLKRIYVRNDQGHVFTLDQFVQFEEVSGSPVLYRFNRFPAATFSANLADGYTLGQGISAMRAVANEILDETFATDLSGQSREFEQAGQSLVFVFILALALVYLVLAAQFESFRDPFIIMMTVPLALTGGLLGLLIFGQTLNIFSQIGLIMLIGLVTKNGILLVEFINQRRSKHENMVDAIIDGASARFRPVLMTSVSTILGILPIAIGLGAGAESRMPLGIAVIGGLLLSTVLTLYVVPAAYSILASRKRTV